MFPPAPAALALESIESGPLAHPSRVEGGSCCIRLPLPVSSASLRRLHPHLHVLVTCPGQVQRWQMPVSLCDSGRALRAPGAGTLPAPACILTPPPSLRPRSRGGVCARRADDSALCRLCLAAHSASPQGTMRVFLSALARQADVWDVRGPSLPGPSVPAGR